MLYRSPANATNGADFGSTTSVELEWDPEERDETWLVSYADMLSVVLAMVVLLFGRMAMIEAPPVEVAAAAGVPVELAVELPAQITARAAAVRAADRAAGEFVLDAAAGFAAVPATAAPTQEDRLASLVEARFSGRIKAEPINEGMRLTIPEVALFDSARAQLQASASPLLTELAATLREVGEARISVEGHTDSVPVQGGEFTSNWDLAAARANAVTRYLLDRGFDPRRLQSVSYADTRPISDNGTADGRAANRRVELQIEFVGAGESRTAL